MKHTAKPTEKTPCSRLSSKRSGKRKPRWRRAFQPTGSCPNAISLYFPSPRTIRSNNPSTKSSPSEGDSLATVEQKPYRLAGMCKRCHEFRFGFLLYGVGPFICQECAKTAHTNSDTTGNNRIYWFTSSINWKQGSE